jgi:hypothetical protein
MFRTESSTSRAFRTESSENRSFKTAARNIININIKPKIFTTVSSNIDFTITNSKRNIVSGTSSLRTEGSESRALNPEGSGTKSLCKGICKARRRLAGNFSLKFECDCHKEPEKKYDNIYMKFFDENIITLTIKEEYKIYIINAEQMFNRYVSWYMSLYRTKPNDNIIDFAIYLNNKTPLGELYMCEENRSRRSLGPKVLNFKNDAKWVYVYFRN